jgi:hypothetical protein
MRMKIRTVQRPKNTGTMMFKGGSACPVISSPNDVSPAWAAISVLHAMKKIARVYNVTATPFQSADKTSAGTKGSPVFVSIDVED